MSSVSSSSQAAVAAREAFAADGDRKPNSGIDELDDDVDTIGDDDDDDDDDCDNADNSSRHRS